MTVYADYSTMVAWEGNPTGIPRTVKCLTEGLLSHNVDVKVVALSDERPQFHIADVKSCELLQPVIFAKGDVLISAGANWAFASYLPEIVRLKDVGVRYHQLFYDLIPTKFPYLYEPGIGFGDYFGDWTRNALALTDCAYAISECSKRDIVEWCGNQYVNKIATLRLGEDYVISPELMGDAPIIEFNFPKPFLLCVGTLELRKNQALLLHVYRKLLTGNIRDVPNLVLVGRRGWIDGNISEQVKNDRLLRDHVTIINDVTDLQLDWLYKNCWFTLFPAVYEGWGLPVAESLRYGKPCISSDAASMTEIAPDLTWFCDPLRVDQWAAAIERCIVNPSVVSIQASKIVENYRTTKWKDVAELILGNV